MPSSTALAELQCFIKKKKKDLYNPPLKGVLLSTGMWELRTRKVGGVKTEIPKTKW